MRFRRQKTLNEVAKHLAALGYKVSAQDGLDSICRALAIYTQRDYPATRDGRWEMLAAFVGKPAEFDAYKRQEDGTNKAKQRQLQKALKTLRKFGAKPPTWVRQKPAEDFFQSDAWMRLRYAVLRERGAACECCGATRADGAIIQVDHIKPRSKYPALALDKSNLQVLCRSCNIGKSNTDETDWRNEIEIDPALAAHLREIAKNG